MVVVLVVSILPFALTSCLNGSENQSATATLEQDIAAIDNYLADNNINAIKDPSGIRMVVSVLGTGFPAQKSSKVDVDYIGKLFVDGSTFDEGNVKTDLQGLITGWQIALLTLPAGSKATLFIPSGYAYGGNAQNGIPANSILMFNIAFNDVIETTTQMQKLAADTVEIDNYLATKNIVAEKDTTGLRYVVTQLGTGNTPGWYDKIKVKIDYKLLSDDTKVVYTLTFEPSEVFYSRVIDQIPNGLKQGLQKLPAGSKATFYLASGLAYGTAGAAINNSQQIIPPNANVILDVDFTEIVTP